MISEEINVVEDTYVLEKPKMVTVKVTMSDIAEDFIAPPEPQSPGEITLQENGAVCVIAKKGKVLGTVPKAVAWAAALVAGTRGPRMRTVRVLMQKPR